MTILGELPYWPTFMMATPAPPRPPAPAPPWQRSGPSGCFACGSYLQRVMTPIKERVAPVAVLHSALGLLGLVAADVTNDPPHVVDVLVGVI